MRVIIAGSRHISPPMDYIDSLVSELSNPVTELVCGYATGVDRAGERWAKSKDIPIKYFEPNWAIGKCAGPIRNAEMADYADALILIWDGKSHGSADMKNKAQYRKLEIVENIFNTTTEGYE